LYFNAENVLRAVLGRLRTESRSIRLVVCDLSASPYVDLAGARMLASLTDELVNHHASLRLAEALAEARDLLRAEGLEAKVGTIDRFTSIADVVEHFQQEPESR